jgi:DNA repair photolyase
MGPDKSLPPHEVGPARKVRGRGAVTSPAPRFEPRHVVLDDGWSDDPDFSPPAAVPTTVTPEVTRGILAKNDSPDVPFDRSINPYKGCEHGCVYCFARPTHSYLGLSPGLDFETKIVSKPDAAARLEETLRKPSYRCDVIALGANTDPYQPIERQLGITRSLLKVFDAFRHPVCIVTKSNLVLRDIDLLARLAARRQASVLISITTLDRELARRMEPRAPTPQRRLEAVAALTEAGVPAGVLAAPMIPGLNDAELERILEAAAAAGARGADYVLLRLPLEVKSIFSGWLEEHYPLRAQHVLSLVRETHGGKIYDPTFGMRMRGTGPYADLLRQRFQKACQRLGLPRRLPPLDTAPFRPPKRPDDPQGSLFGE